MRGRGSWFGGVATALAWKPEWPVALLAGVAWLMLYLLSAADADQTIHHSDGAAGSLIAVARSVGSWGLMSFAMMMPATLPAVRHVALNSIRTRRRRAMALYALAYLAVWIVYGVLVVTVVALAIRGGASDRQLVVFMLAMATVWQLTRTKRRSVIACRRTVPLPPEGWRADVACMHFGVLQAWRCLVSCWPLMLLMAVVGHEFTLMIALALIVLAEERLSMRDRVIVPFAAVFAAATVFTIVVR